MTTGRAVSDSGDQDTKVGLRALGLGDMALVMGDPGFEGRDTRDLSGLMSQVCALDLPVAPV